MTNDYISREAAMTVLDWDCASQDALNAIKAIPAADAVAVVRCRECKYRIVNEHFGEKGYMGLKAMCELDTGDPFELGRNAEDDDWFCADGERKDGGQDDA